MDDVRDRMTDHRGEPTVVPGTWYGGGTGSLLTNITSTRYLVLPVCSLCIPVVPVGNLRELSFS
jgi:hypothetical protein